LLFVDCIVKYLTIDYSTIILNILNGNDYMQVKFMVNVINDYGKTNIHIFLENYQLPTYCYP